MKKEYFGAFSEWTIVCFVVILYAIEFVISSCLLITSLNSCVQDFI